MRLSGQFIYLFIIYLFIYYLFIYLFIHLFIYLFICFFYLFIYLFIYFIKIICTPKKTHKLCLKILICLKSIIKHTSNFHLDIKPRSIIKHTSNFHLDITPRSIKKTNNFSSKYFYTLKKAHKQLSFRHYA